MNRMKIGAIVLAGGVVLGSAAGASALERRNADARFGANRQQDVQKDEKRAFRQSIQAKQREYRELRRANDPRADQVRLEIRAMKDEWERRYGADDGQRERGQRKHGNAEKTKKPRKH